MRKWLPIWVILFVLVILGFLGAVASAQIVRPVATPRAAGTARAAATPHTGFAEGNCSDSNVALWEDFEESSGNLTVPTGCAASGVVLVAGGTPTYAADGPSGAGKAITFDGSDWFATAGDEATLDVGAATAMVVELWANWSSAGGDFVAKGASPGWRVFSSSGRVNFTVTDATTTCSPTNSAVANDGAWHFIRVTWDGVSACTMAVDGVSTAAGATAVVGSMNNATSFSVAARYPGAVNPLTGSIADLRVTIGNATNDLSVKIKTPVPNFFISGKLPAKQRQGNCSDSNVALWEDFEESSGNLTVPSGCAASGTVLTAGGSPTYQERLSDDMPGLGLAVVLPATASFKSAADVAALDPGTSSMVVEFSFRLDAGGSFKIDKGQEGADAAGWTAFVGTANGGTSLDVWANDFGQECWATNSGLTSVTTGRWYRYRAVWNQAAQTCTLTYFDLVGTNVNASVAVTGGTLTSVDSPSVFSIGDGAGAVSHAAFTIADLRVTIGNATNDLGFNAGASSGTSGATLTAPTFTRTTVSTRVNPVTGLVEAVASGVPVVGAPLSSGDDGSIDSTEPTGVYVGSATTFTLLRNETLSNAVWDTSLGASVTDDADTSPDGTVTADTVTDDSGAATESLFQDVTVAADASSWTFSVWLRCPTTTQQVGIANELGASNTTTSVTCSSTWQKVVATKTNNGVDTSARLYIYAANAADANTGSVNVWRPQFYNKAAAVPIDPAVAASSVTVNADALTYANTALTTSAMTIVAWDNICAGTSGDITTVQDYAAIVDVKTGSYQNFTFEANASNTVVGVRITPYGQISFGTSPAFQTWHHYALRLSSGASSAYLDGVQSGSTSATTYTAGTPASIRVGSRPSDGLAGCQILGDVRIYDKLLTPQQIRALYLSSSSLYADRDMTPREKLRRKVMLAAAVPLDTLWGVFAPRRIEAEKIDAARRYVASDAFPQAAWTMPREAQ